MPFHPYPNLGSLSGILSVSKPGKACQKVMPNGHRKKITKACQKVMPNGHRKEFLGQFGLPQIFQVCRDARQSLSKVMSEWHRKEFGGEYQFSILHPHGCINSIYPTSNWVHYWPTLYTPNPLATLYTPNPLAIQYTPNLAITTNWAHHWPR